MTPAIVLGVALLLALILAYSSIRIAREYERGVVFRLGRLINLKGPGLFLILPFGIDRLIKVDLLRRNLQRDHPRRSSDLLSRVVTLEVPPQEVITLDN